MKPIHFACLLLCTTAAIFSSQSNPVPLINPSAKPAHAVIASQASPKAQALQPQARKPQEKILASYGHLPLSFEVNRGQTDAQVKFLSRTSAYTLFLTGDEAVLTWSGKTPEKAAPKTLIKSPVETRPAASAEHTTGAVLRMKLRNANPAAKVTGVDELPGKSNYFIGNDPAKWRTNVPTYAKVKYEGIYSGIDLVYYGNRSDGKAGQLEHDFIVAPGADPRRIAFDVSGAKRIRQDAQGDLVLSMKMGEGEIRWHKPVVYQEKDGARQEIAARYAITDKNRVGFELAEFDASRPLYIDPLIYSTYLGGSGGDAGAGIAVDSTGNAYVTGSTGSSDFPTKNPLQPTLNDNYSAFVTKLNPEGSALVYSTYLGSTGAGYGDRGTGIAVDSEGNAYVIGYSNSNDFPTTPGAFQTTCNSGECGFASKLNPSGSALVYSTDIGNGYPFGIAVDSGGNAFVTGFTDYYGFPVTPGAFQTTCNGYLFCNSAFVTEFNPTGTALVYSTFLGGRGHDSGYAIALDSQDDAYVTGLTSSFDFPISPGAFQTTCKGFDYTCWNAFVTKLNPTGTAVVYSTFLGGSGGLTADGVVGDTAFGIAVDNAGNAYVTGMTCSADFPTMNPWQPTNGDTGCPLFSQTYLYRLFWGNAFVSKLNPEGSALVYSTYLGGSGTGTYGGAFGTGIAVDSTGSAYVTGVTRSGFPQKNRLQNYGGGTDAFVTKFNPPGLALVYSTDLGGSRYDGSFGITVDSAGNAYVTGETASTNFPVTPGAFQTTSRGGSGISTAFVTKIFIAAVTATTLTSSPNPSHYGEPVTFTAVVTSALGPPPDGETLSFMKGKTVLGTGTLSGGTATFVTSTFKVGTTSVTAVYGGDSNFAGSKSKPVKQVVQKAEQ